MMASLAFHFGCLVTLMSTSTTINNSWASALSLQVLHPMPTTLGTGRPLSSPESCPSFSPPRFGGPFTTRSDVAVATTSTALFGARTKKKKGGGGNKKKKTSASSKSGRSFGFGKAAGKWDGCEPLRAWMSRNGADVEGVSVGVVDPKTGLRGTLAARDFARGDPVFKVPRDTCILDETKADRSPMSRHLYPTPSQREALPPPIRSALLLLWLQRIESIPSASEEDKEEAEHWRTYLEMLPTPAEFEAEGGPLQLWSDGELAQVECPQLIAEVATRKASLRAHYDERVLPAWTAAAEAAMGPPPTFEEFQHAVCVVTTRNYGEGPVTGGSSSMLIPGVDLANHEDPPRANTKYGIAPWGDFVLLAQTTIDAGDEILSTYGPLPNRLLLTQFGFLLKDRTDTSTPLISDTALVRIDGLFPDSLPSQGDSSSLSVPEAEAAADAAWFQGPGPSMLAGIQGNKDSEGRVARWQPAEAARSAARIMFADSDAEDASEQATKAFKQLVQRELDMYSTTLAEDEATLASWNDLPSRTTLALQSRIEAKRLLMKEVSTV